MIPTAIEATPTMPAMTMSATSPITRSSTIVMNDFVFDPVSRAA